jgi:predicted peptidase
MDSPCRNPSSLVILKNVFKLLVPISYVLHPLVQVPFWTFGIVTAPGVAGPEGYSAAVEVAAVSEVAGPGVDFAGIVFVAPVSVAYVSELRASVDIAVAFDVLVPVSVVAAEADSSGRPRFSAFPNADYFASFSSSV